LLKGRGRVDKLKGGEVAERLNAAVSKTVTSVIPASGVRIPPSPPSWLTRRRSLGLSESFVSGAYDAGPWSGVVFG
jgi:hypothetical protein